MTRTVLHALALSLATLLAGAEETVEVRRPAQAGGIVEIDNPAGSVKVVGWDRAEVLVTGRLGRGATGVDVSGGGRRLRVSVETEGNPHATQSHLEVKVPAGSSIEASSFTAAITVTGVTGLVTAHSVNGSLAISGAAREVVAETVNGNIAIDASAKRVKAEAVNGTIDVKGSSGEIEVSTVAGTLAVRGGSFERVSLESVSGDIHFAGGLAGRGTLDAETVSGSVELVLPSAVAADFTLSTFSGEIENELGPRAERTSRHTPEKSLEFASNGGGASVGVNTLSGGITIRKR